MAGADGEGEPSSRARATRAGSTVGITAVAKHAGVSPATVSRVMRGTTRVNGELADRVRRAVDELGYRPNAAAQGLVSGRFRSIGVVMPDMSNPYFSLVMQAVAGRAETEDYRMIVAESRARPGEELAICEGLERQVDGLLLIAPQMPAQDLRAVSRLGTPAVVVNRIEVGVDLPMVAVDNFVGMSEICQHLLSLGHRDAVYLAGPAESWQNRERWRGVEHAAIFGLHARRIDTDGTLRGGFEGAVAAVDDPEHRPVTALICFNDIVAAGAIAALRERDLDVPGDLSVTGYDDSMLATFHHPPLTTARSPIEELGRAAWARLWAQIDGATPPSDPVLRTTVVIRASSAPPP